MKQMIFVPVDVMVAHLNGLLKADPEAIAELVGHRIVTENRTLVDGDYPIVMAPVSETQYRFGIVGVLNGMVVGGKVAAAYVDEELTRLSHFEAKYNEFPNEVEPE